MADEALEDKLAAQMEPIIERFAKDMIGHIAESGHDSVTAIGRVQMPNGRYIAWNIDLGYEVDDDAEDDDNRDSDTGDDEEDVALVAVHPKKLRRDLN